MKGDSILITTGGGEGSCLYFSANGGQSWSNSTNGFGGSGSDFLDPLEIVLDPTNSSTVYAMAGDCVAKSTDFGKSWNAVKNSWGAISYQPVILRVNPLNKNQVISGGEAGNFHSYLDISFNAGSSWTQYAYEDNNAVNCLEFHPTNPAIMYIGKEGKIDHSIDSGKTWQTTYVPPVGMYIYAISQPNSQAVYATGSYNNVSFAKDTLHLFKSTDDGKTWKKFHQEYIPNCGGGAEMTIHDSIVYILTWDKGVYTINLRDLPTNIQSPNKADEFAIRHQGDFLTIAHTKDHDFMATIFAMSGQMVYTTTSGNNPIATYSWPNGVYVVNVQSATSRMTQKVLISR